MDKGKEGIKESMKEPEDEIYALSICM